MSGRRILLDASMLCLAFTAVFLISAAIDVGIWAGDYPPDIRAAAGDLQTSGTLRIIVALAVAAVLIAGPLVSNMLLRNELLDRFNFASSFLHTLALFWIVNVYDLLVIDWLLFTTIQPDFLVLSGTEGMPGYDDYSFHFRESFLNRVPWIASLALATVIALVSVLTHKVLRRASSPGGPEA